MSLTALTNLGRRYARAWCSQDPKSVGRFFAKNGSLIVNGGAPAIGRAAISKVAGSSMSDFPDMQLSMRGLLREARGTVFHWSLAGTNTGPGGTGHRVRIDGYEVWRIDDDGLIAASEEHFDAAEYAFQITHGVDAPRDEDRDPPAPAVPGRRSLSLGRRKR